MRELASYEKLLYGIAITTVGWLAVTFATRPTDLATLRNFYTVTRPGGPGWQPVTQGIDRPISTAADGQLPLRILAMLVGAVAIYAVLFATGYYLYGRITSALIAGSIALTGIVLLFTFWRRLQGPVKHRDKESLSH